MSAGQEVSTPRKRPSPMKGVAVLVATLAALLGAAEIGLRLARYDPVSRIVSENGFESRFMIQESDDPVLVYEFAPGTTGEMWGSEIAINQHGLREREVPLEKPEGRKRVLAVGDSVTFGPALDLTQRWSDYIGIRWREWGANAEVINLGVPGYDVAQEVRFVERKGLAFHPDEVLMCFCINDVETVSFDFDMIVTLKRFKSGILSWSRLAQWVTLRLDKLRQAESAAAVFDRERIAIASAAITPDPELAALVARLEDAMARAGEPGPVLDRDSVSFRNDKFRGRLRLFTELGRLQLVRNAYARLAEVARENGFGVTVFVAPVLYEGLDEEGWPIAYQLVRHLAESAGFSFIDVYPAMKAAGLETMHVTPNDFVHINAGGHAILARELLAGTRRWFL